MKDWSNTPTIRSPVEGSELPTGIKHVVDHAMKNGVYYDGFVESLMRNNERLSDRDLNTLWLSLPLIDEAKRAKGNKTYYTNILESEYLPTTNPVKDWIESLRHNGGNHISALAAMLQTDTEPILVERILRHWMVSAIAALTIDHVPQGMLILTGGQGIGKSTWLRHLCPPKIRSYYTETLPDLHNKDSLSALAYNVMINISELSTFSKSDYNTIKSFLTLSKLQCRKAYGHFLVNMRRKASFCGDTNHERFLTDPTGNRRFWIIKLKDIPNPISEVPDYCGDAAWAEALAIRDEILKDNRVFITDMLESAEEFYQPPDMLSAFLDLFHKPEHPSEIGYCELSSTEIMGRIVESNRSIKGSSVNLGKELHRLGFEQKMRKISGFCNRKWCVAENQKTTEVEEF